MSAEPVGLNLTMTTRIVSRPGLLVALMGFCMGLAGPGCKACSKSGRDGDAGDLAQAPAVKISTRILCQAGKAGPDAKVPPAGFTGIVPEARNDDPTRAAQWLFSAQAGLGFAKQPWRIEAVSLKLAFGRNLVSDAYQLYRGFFGREGIDEKQRFALISLDNKRALSMSSCTEYNALVASLDRGPRSKPDTIATARSYLLMVDDFGDQDLVLEYEQASPSAELKAIFDWFKDHPGAGMHYLQYERKQTRTELRFWSWRRAGGVLRRFVLVLDPQGRILEHSEQQVDERVGLYEKI